MGRGGKDWEYGISRGKLLYTAWVNNKVLLYNTGNYIQCPIKTIMEKHMNKTTCIYVRICIPESLCCTEEIDIVNQLYFNKIFKIEKS